MKKGGGGEKEKSDIVNIWYSKSKLNVKIGSNGDNRQTLVYDYEYVYCPSMRATFVIVLGCLQSKAQRKCMDMNLTLSKSQNLNYSN